MAEIAGARSERRANVFDMTAKLSIMKARETDRRLDLQEDEVSFPVTTDVQGVIFDFGGVYTRDPGRLRVWRRCEAQLGLENGALSAVFHSGDHWYDVSTGKTSAQEYWGRVQELLEGRVPAELEPFRYNPFAYEALNARVVHLMRWLHRRYRTALLSNATIHLDTLLAEHGLMDSFDTVINSARVGLRKPDPEIFRLTCDRLGLPPAQCLFVDDKERNTQVAVEMGMKAIVFRSAADVMRQMREMGVLPARAEPRQGG